MSELLGARELNCELIFDFHLAAFPKTM